MTTPSLLLAVPLLGAAAAAPASPLPAPAAAAAPATEAKPEAPRVELGGLVQVWWAGQQQSVEGDRDPTPSYFRVRRAELRARGEVVPGVASFGVMIDPARVVDSDPERVTMPDGTESTSRHSTLRTASVLQDAFVTFISPWVDVTAGQFKIPISWEGTQSSSKLLLPERASSSTTFGDRRDLGVKLTKCVVDREGSGCAASYWLALHSGERQGTSEELAGSARKDVALRLEGSPLPWLLVGAAALASVGERDAAGARDRAELDLRVTPGDAVLQTEWIEARDRVTSGGTTVWRRGRGFYVAAGYTLGGKVQPVVRVGRVDPDVDSDAPDAAGYGTGARASQQEAAWTAELGGSWLVRGDTAKLQLVAGRVVHAHAPARSQVIVAGQVAF
ncbi:MAG: hypothetical protein IT376_16350 [Polyangiaceae bacterium]|nr:hypothetical protein [Polyangiaceae bacterium]